MKKIQRCLLILWIGSGVLLSGLSIADDQELSSDPMEIIAQGKQYKSIRAYKQEQIKSALERTLSSYDLMKFSEDELYGIMKEVRKQQAGSSSLMEDLESVGQSDSGLLEDQRTVEGNSKDPGVSQMQEMLRQYRREHKSSGRVFLDPDKVKSIIIKPQKKPEDTPKN